MQRKNLERLVPDWMRGISVRYQLAVVVGRSDWKDECAFARTRTVGRDSKFWKEYDVCVCVILGIRFDVGNRIKEMNFHNFT